MLKPAICVAFREMLTTGGRERLVRLPPACLNGESAAPCLFFIDHSVDKQFKRPCSDKQSDHFSASRRAKAATACGKRQN